MQQLKIEPFLEHLKTLNFNGTWESNSTIKIFPQKADDFLENKGNIKIVFNYNKNKTDDLFTASFNILDGKYRDHWIYIYKTFDYHYGHTAENTNITFASKLDNEQYKKDYTSIVSLNYDKCELKIFHLNDCVYSDYNIISKIYFNFYKENLIHLEGNFTLNDIFISFNTTNNISSQNKADVKQYNIFLICLLIINTIYSKGIKSCLELIRIEELSPKVLSPICLLFNAFWNIDLIFLCLYLKRINHINSIYITFTMILMFMNFMSNDLRLFLDAYNYQIGENRRKRTYYFILISLILFFNFKCIMNNYILLNPVLLFINSFSFIPEIILLYKNNYIRKNVPFFLFRIIFFNKMFFPIYYRIIPNNIFNSKPNYIFVIIIVFLYILQYLILKIQNYFGGNFCKRIRKKYKGKKAVYYPNEIDQISKNIFKEDSICPICLQTLVEDNKLTINSNNIEQIENESNPVELIEKNEKEKNKNKKCCNCSFFRKKENNEDKIVILTLCNHLFHYTCLNTWIEEDRMCPICRKIFTDEEIMSFNTTCCIGQINDTNSSHIRLENNN